MAASTVGNILNQAGIDPVGLVRSSPQVERV
jgi:hypothetical protein